MQGVDWDKEMGDFYPLKDCSSKSGPMGSCWFNCILMLHVRLCLLSNVPSNMILFLKCVSSTKLQYKVLNLQKLKYLIVKVIPKVKIVLYFNRNINF